MPLVSSTETRAVVLDLYIQQGCDFTYVLSLQNNDGSPLSLTSYTAQMQVRETPSHSTILLELSTANSRIINGGPTGQLTLTLNNVTTSAIAWRSGVYDLEITSPGGVVSRIIEGNVTVGLEVTR